MLQIFLLLVTFRFTSDSGMWQYGITVIAHVSLHCKSCKKNLCGIDFYATSQNKFAPECYMSYISDTIVLHAAITGKAHVVLRYNTIMQRPLHFINALL
jgi:hypothetical protein